MITIPLKPLSVNEAWQGRRYKTDKYKQFERDCLKLLPATINIPNDKFLIILVWGFSSAASDYDNPIKPFTDVLQKKYGFDDKQIQAALIIKRKVKGGQEYIKFKTECITDEQVDRLLELVA